MQDKANDIMANVDITLNKQQEQVVQGTTYKNTNPTSIHNNYVQRDRNPLFPNVDPYTIGQHRNNEDQYPNLPSPDKYDGNSMFTEKEATFHDNEYIYTRRHFVNTNTFYKLKWNTKCTGENDIMSFYESLQHMASTCGISMRNLDDIDDNHGVCPLDPTNCQNYDQIYKLMKGSVFYKINDEKLWTGYSQGWNLVKSNLLCCDGFEVLNDVLSELLSKLNINTPKSHKLQRPQYSNQDDDNIYSYINDYNGFLKFKSLENHSRTYSPYEIAMYIADDIEKDPHKRFDKGVDYLRLQLKQSTDGINVPRDITIAKIAKTICKYSPEYEVGEHYTQPTPVIHATKLPSTFKSNYTSPRQSNRRIPRDMTLRCKFCQQIGHNATSEDGCFIFAKWTLCQQASQRVPESEIKANTRKYLKSIKQRQMNAKNSKELTRHIKSLQELEQPLDTNALIHSLQMIHHGEDSDSDSSTSSSDREWHGQVEELPTPGILPEPEPPPLLEQHDPTWL